MNLTQRQSRTLLSTEFQNQPDIFPVLIETCLRCEVSAEHLRSFRIHRARIRRAALQNRQHLRQINATASCQTQTLRQYRAIQSQYQIHDQLGRRPAAARPVWN